MPSIILYNGDNFAAWWLQWCLPWFCVSLPEMMLLTYCYLLACLLTYLLTYFMERSPSWEVNCFSDSQEIPQILWNPKLITAFTSVCHLSLSRARSSHFMPPHPTSWRSILILSSHLYLGLPSGLFPQVSLPKPCIHLSSPQYMLHIPPSLSFVSIFITRTLFGEEYR